MRCVYKPSINKNSIPAHIPNEKIISTVLSEKSRQICDGEKTTSPKSTNFLLAIKALIDGDVDVIATQWSRMIILREKNKIIIDHRFSSIIDEFELDGWQLIPKEKL